MERKSTRIYVGGLGESVSRDDILKIFSPLGSVEAVDFVRTKGRSFAYIDFSPSSPNSLSKLFSTYNGCVWKGGRLRLEKAKEHYMARFRREWEEYATLSATCPSLNPSMPKPSAPDSPTHLHIFFPRLRKVRSVPFSGTGKHKYSFQHVQVPSLPKYFCDCEEHSVSPTPQRNHVHDVERHYGGINEEELNIMNSVMNRLFRTYSEKSDPVHHEDNNVRPNQLDFEADEDNLVINVVSCANNTFPFSRNWVQESASRKRKSVSSGTKTPGQGSPSYDTEGQKVNGIHPSKKRQLTGHEGDGGKKCTLTQPENNQVSKADADKSLAGLRGSVSGAKQSTGGVYWSQKSSWEALVVNGDSSKFCVSHVLSGIASSKEEQPPSCDTDFTDMPIQENLVLKDSDVPSSTQGPTAKNVIKQGIKRLTPMRKTWNLVVADVNESNEFSAGDPEGGDISTTHANTKTATTVEAESTGAESSAKSSATDPSFHKGLGKVFSGDFVGNQCVSSLLGSTKDYHTASENCSSAVDVKKNVVDEFDKEDAGKGLSGASDRSTRGSSWLQKSTWTQLVSEKNSSFSITQLFPDRILEKQEPREVGHGAAEEPDFSKSKREVKADEITGGMTGDSPKGQGMIMMKTFVGNRRIGETCKFMRSAASLKEWANAKKALTGTRKKRGNEK